jgi:iron only hydrogenase large subunit-like protein
VRECPQRAKTVRSDLDAAKSLVAKSLLDGGAVVAASIAPSFAALFPGTLAYRLPSALRKLGFCFVGETAEGAAYITDKSLEEGQAGSICAACPAVVNYVEKYQPQYIDALIPVVSPMIAHGRMIKAGRPGCAVVFIGPCAAKKGEITRPENVGAVDVVLTFSELLEWFAQERIHTEDCIDSSFDRIAKIGDARLFPLEGGMLKTGGIKNDVGQAEIMSVSGPEDVMHLFADKPDFNGKLIEPLFCKGGCIGGPCFADEHISSFDISLLARRNNVIHYADASRNESESRHETNITHTTYYKPTAQEQELVSDSRIQKIYERTGKTNPSNQLNCGACGYKSCLENAIAVARGMAEPEMCMPYMRRLAQQRSDRIIETNPCGIVILDSELCMIQMNPAFQKMFMCNNGILGRRISYLVNADGFEFLQSGEKEQYESIQFKYGFKYHEILYALHDEGQYVGIYSDISKVRFDTRQLDAIKAQTVMHAREFLDHQVRFAQEMAHFLGKSTARSEEIARDLINLYEDEGEA